MRNETQDMLNRRIISYLLKVTSTLCNIIRINKTFNQNDAAHGNSHPYHQFKL